MNLQSGHRPGRYEVLGPIGAGGMGEDDVFRLVKKSCVHEIAHIGDTVATGDTG